jgi:signal transduction histidine kinase
VTQDALLARLARLERIIEITSSLNSTLSLRPLLQKILGAAQELTNTEAGSIMLIDRKTGELHFEAATGARSEEIASIVVPMEGSVAGWVVQHGRPVIIHDARSDPRLYRQIQDEIEYETRSLIAAPLAVKGKLIGVLEAVNKCGDARFSEEDVDILVALADQAAVAIENAVLFEQSDLISEIVHEMRTPLTSISGYAQMIQRDDVTEEERQAFAGTIQREAARLNRLTSGFLDLARLESGRATFNREPVSLEGVVVEAVDLLRPQARDKGIALGAEPPGGTLTLVGDRQRVHQALVNLLGNAVKYCRPGDSVTVTARAAGPEVVICVADSGPGIPRQAQERLFDRFYCVPGTGGLARGTGLGLAITRKIAEAHGGRIWVESEEGRGSSFYLALPLDAA